MKWKVDENKELPVAVIEDTENGFGICELDGGGVASRDELEKTARLIAAAPDLLDACKYTIESLRKVKGKAFPIMPIMDAITKAEHGQMAGEDGMI